MEVDLIDAWQIWSSGVMLDDHSLFGQSMLFWSRLGKIFQFLGAFILVIEVLGYDRLSGFSKNLSSQFSKANFQKISGFGINKFKEYYNYISLDSEGRKQIDLKSPIERSSIGLIGVVALFVTIKVVSNFNLHWILDFLIGSILFALLGWIIPILFALIVSFTGFSIYFLSLIILKPFLYILGSPKLNLIVQILSLILLSIGFHFDLLTS